jgi:hypothetical protein
VLSDFSDVLQIARIPAGKTPGAWAQSIGLATQQRFRERTRKARVLTGGEGGGRTLRFPPFTQRDLLTLFPAQPSVAAILTGPKPHRAREYWRKAMQILIDLEIVDYDLRAERAPDMRSGWQDAWLDEPLEIRPAGAGLEAALEITTNVAEARKKWSPRKP